MSTRNLDHMFSPKSISVIGSTDKPDQFGSLIIRNILDAHFEGPVLPVNLHKKSVCGILAYPSIESLPFATELGVICDLDHLMDRLIAFGEKGTKAIILVPPLIEDCKSTTQQIKAICRDYDLQILGANSLGAIVPSKNLNVSRFHLPIRKGKIAFVSQSGAICSSVLDWAHANGVGFSYFISLGDSTGVDFGDIIDFLGSDPFTRAILIYMESIHEQRDFMSAARASARNKPILVIKTGKHEEMSLITQSHTGAMAGSDLVYDAAFRRAGMLRVDSIAELFAGAETLAMTRPFKGKRLGIISNGGGLNILVTDHLLDEKGQLAEFSEETIEKLKSVHPHLKDISNPLDMGALAKPDTYGKTYEILKKAKEVDCVLCLHTPVSQVDSYACAQSLVDSFKKSKGNLITCWMGEKTLESARNLLEESSIPSYASPRMAIMGFLHIVHYVENQVTLMETPERVPENVKPARQKVRRIIHKALKDNLSWLSETQVKAILSAYGIKTVAPYVALTAPEAAKIAEEIGFPVVVKIMSPDIVHKSDVGGVVLSLQDKSSVEKAVEDMTTRILDFNKSARIEGFVIQKMIDRTPGFELIAGMTHDPIFGPVMLFGQGGTATEVIGDRAIALPPLNMGLAKDLIERTQINKLLGGFRNHPPVDRTKLCQVLIELSEICIDFPEIQEIDLNPIISTHEDAIVIDSRIRIKEITDPFPNRRLAIRPYPKHLEENFTLRNGREVLIRPIKPEDEPNHVAFMSKISEQDLRYRFFGTVRELPHSEMARLTQINYDREMAFIAEAPDEEGKMETLGVVRTGTDPNNEDAEYAIMVRSDMKGQKLGFKMLNKMIEYCRSRGTTYFTGQILRENRPMLDMVLSMGFESVRSEEDDIVDVRLKLQDD